MKYQGIKVGPLLELKNPCHCHGIGAVGAKTVDRLGREGNDIALLQKASGPSD